MPILLVLDSYSYFTLYTNTTCSRSFIVRLKIFEALCPLIELITDVVGFLGFLDTPTDLKGDGCFVDEAGPFGKVLGITPFGLVGW